MAPDLECVSHCWNYSRLLSYQLSSLVLTPPVCQVQMTVCFSLSDADTVSVIEFFEHKTSRNVKIVGLSMTPEQLCRRAIGRNLAAKATKAGLLWLCDGDQPFGKGCLDAVVEKYDRTKLLCYPRYVCKSTLEYGDSLIAAAERPAVRPVDPTQFTPVKFGRAIGGIQITTGDCAREKGYLPNHRRYQRPAAHWVRTHDDPVYRRYLGEGTGTPIDVPNVMRIRHSKYGRTHIGCQN